MIDGRLTTFFDLLLFGKGISTQKNLIKLRVFKFSEKIYNLWFKYIFTSWNRNWICYILEKENLSKWRGNKNDDLFTNLFLLIDVYYIINIKILWKQHFLGKNYLVCRTYFYLESFDYQILLFSRKKSLKVFKNYIFLMF